MKVIEKIKSINRKKIVIVGILILLIVTTVLIAMTAANEKGGDTAQPSDKSDTEGKSVSVFKEQAGESGDKQEADTVEPIDLSGINGLAYQSKGDGTCTIMGIGTCTETELKIPAYSPSGDVVIKIADGAFTNCTQLLTVTVPATVKTIGAGAFRGCTDLVAINVDTENTVYSSSSGVLFSKDRSVLVCYPVNRPGANYLLNTDVKAVAAYAFEGAANLKNLLYEGSISEFQKIDFLMGNGILDEVAITCNYVSAK